MRLKINYTIPKSTTRSIIYFTFSGILLIMGIYYLFFTNSTDKLFMAGLILIPIVIFSLMGIGKLKDKNVSNMIECDSYTNMDEVDYPKYEKEE